jgi:arginyl-tRNA synthetase
LLDVFVKANALADEDPEFAVKVRNAFSAALENRDQDNLDIWEMCRVKELEKNYFKLNVEFDHYYHGESMFSSDTSKQVIQRLGDEDLVKDTDDGRKVIDLDEKNRVTIIKSDGISLYIRRDIAAALDRREKFGFEKMIYVVDNAQGYHFQNLFKILSGLGCGWSQECRHVKFGKILGISTRRGNMVYISDLMEEATEIMLENQEKSENTRIF